MTTPQIDKAVWILMADLCLASDLIFVEVLGLLLIFARLSLLKPTLGRTLEHS